MSRLDKILDDIANDGEEKEKATPQTEPAVEEPEKDDVPPDDEPERRDEPPKDEPPKDEQPAGDEPNPEGQPHDEPPKEKKDIPDDPMKRAEFSFKRQLSKQKEKHEKELADRDAKLAEMQKKLEEFEKKLTPKPALKTRDDFRQGDGGDEEFVQYLAEERVKAILAERDEAEAKKQAERDEEARKKEAEQAELRAKQEEWIGHVHEAFGGDKARSDKFLEKVAYANGHGLGQVLDNCPVAADYLINDPMGPLVFEKILTDRPTFERVFDPRRTSPLAVYHELRVVEDSIKAEQQAPGGQPAQQRTNVVPAMGRPGKQAGSSSLANTDMFDDPKALRKWMREHR